jgi:Uncharacterized conserved protein
MIEANWLIFIAALLIGIVVAYWVFAHASKPPKREYKKDVLDEGAAPAQRNQALIDAPPAASFEAPPHIDPPAMAGTMAGIGEVIAVAAQQEVDNREPSEPAENLADDSPAEKPVAPPAQQAPTSTGEADDLRKIKGLGPKMLAVLHGLGITRYAQIAAWTDADLDQLDSRLGSFAGRPRRDNWVEQAKLLAEGETGAYEARFGKL